MLSHDRDFVVMIARVVFVAVLVTLLAFIPRALVVPTMVTADEDTWLGMSGNFARAIATGEFADAFQLGHPGITSLWIDIIGIGPQRAYDLAQLDKFDQSSPTRRAASDAAGERLIIKPFIIRYR